MIPLNNDEQKSFLEFLYLYVENCLLNSTNFRLQTFRTFLSPVKTLNKFLVYFSKFNGYKKFSLKHIIRTVYR